VRQIIFFCPAGTLAGTGCSTVIGLADRGSTVGALIPKLLLFTDSRSTGTGVVDDRTHWTQFFPFREDGLQAG